VVRMCLDRQFDLAGHHRWTAVLLVAQEQNYRRLTPPAMLFAAAVVVAVLVSVDDVHLLEAD
jgi:hypothetical protein